MKEKEILEGLSSNFYAVAGGTIFTAEDGVLSGTTREYVLTLIRSLGLPIVFRPIHLLDLHSTDEAFVVPVPAVQFYRFDGLMLSNW